MNTKITLLAFLYIGTALLLNAACPPIKVNLIKYESETVLSELIGFSGFNDGTGYYFARDIDGGLIVLDTWKRGNDRTNSNFVIMGTARNWKIYSSEAFNIK